MPNDPIDLLEGLTTMPAPQPTWAPLDLTEFEDEVRVVDTFDETYRPPEPTPEPEPEPIGRLRHRLTWAERARQDIDDLRLTIGQAQANLRDAADGCKAIHYHPEVTAQVAAALERTVEALRLIDLFDPE